MLKRIAAAIGRRLLRSGYLDEALAARLGEPVGLRVSPDRRFVPESSEDLVRKSLAVEIGIGQVELFERRRHGDVPWARIGFGSRHSSPQDARDDARTAHAS